MVRAFSVVALLAVSLQAVLLVTLHVLPTKYDPVHDAISDYGVGQYRVYFWAQLLAGGTACIALAVESPPRPRAWPGCRITMPSGRERKV